MRHYGLIGRHLSHSFSKNFFTVKFSNEGIDADYSLIEIEDIATIDQIIAKHELSGFNVTIPYKESIIPYLDELSDEAKVVGAVNCVVIREGRKIGHNTDITGIEHFSEASCAVELSKDLFPNENCFIMFVSFRFGCITHPKYLYKRSIY